MSENETLTESASFADVKNGEAHHIIAAGGLPFWEKSPSSVRLNLGAGTVEIPGFTPIDRKQGREAYPLDYPDGSVAEIRASHLLEHFPHGKVDAVLQEWVRVLEPGGRICLSVPDFAVLAEAYLDGAPLNIQGCVMGGQTDEDDFHGAIFDRDNLLELMLRCGLERIGPWAPDRIDTSYQAISLNLQGYKPISKEEITEGKVGACLSAPRFGPTMHHFCAHAALGALHIPYKVSQSCFWHQHISNLMEGVLEAGADYVLTLDFDTVFCTGDVRELYRLLKACPEADAVCALQSKRGNRETLFTGANHGKPVTMADLDRHLLPIRTGHFGLTLFRAESLRKFPRPWMVPKPSAEGKWTYGECIDADIAFWRNWEANGFKLFLAPRVKVGHLEEVVKWPGPDLLPIYQGQDDYADNGIPAEVRR